MLLVWFLQLGSSLLGSQEGGLRQAKQAISTHSNSTAQQLLKAAEPWDCWLPGRGQVSREPGAGAEAHTRACAHPHSALEARKAHQFRQEPG